MVDNVDAHVGERVRTRRLLAGLSQDAFASYLGITFQQVQKYEKGANRISASRLYRIAKILNAPITYFFDDADKQTMPPDMTREGLELIRAFSMITDPDIRDRILSLLQALGASSR